MLLILYISFCCKFNCLQLPLMQNTLKMFVKACFSLESTQALHIVQNTTISVKYSCCLYLISLLASVPAHAGSRSGALCPCPSSLCFTPWAAAGMWELRCRRAWWPCWSGGLCASCKPESLGLLTCCTGQRPQTVVYLQSRV